MWWIVVALQLSSSYAQLTPPDEPVCVGKQVVFVCQQTGPTLRWTVNLPGGVSNTISNSALSSQVGTVLTFANDHFGFEIHILASSSNSSVTSELHVTAVRQLNGVTVECFGGGGAHRSTIQISLAHLPAAPSGVKTTADQSQFTPRTASITLTWSASSVADNYTIMVTPLLPSGQSLVSTTTTSLPLTVLYNTDYSINITAHNCVGSNSTIIPLIIVGCSPPSPPTNGRNIAYSSGAVGAMLTFQCDTGYMPQEEVTSTCMSNSRWVPLPGCEEVDCGAPFDPSDVNTEPFNNTKFGALITFHCEENNNSMTVVCGNDGEWDPNPASFICGDETTITVSESGSEHDTSDLNKTKSEPDSFSLVGLYVGISVAVMFLLITLTILVIVISVAVKKKRGVRRKLMPSYNLETIEDSNNEDDQQYALTRHPGPRTNNQVVGEEYYSVLNHNISTELHKTPSGRGDTLIYADLGPSSGKRRTPVTSNIQDDHRVVYSTVNQALQQVTKKRNHNKTHDKTGPCPADAALDLDMLLIQLKPQVLTKWKQFAEAVGLSNIIKELSQYSEDECIVEVFDQWLKSHPTKPTWRNVADVLNDIGLQQLAKDILKVYQTGNLPIVVDMDAVPEMTSDTETPPPLPPKIDDDDLFLPARPPKPAA